jgi:hypothetical protein
MTKSTDQSPAAKIERARANVQQLDAVLAGLNAKRRDVLMADGAASELAKFDAEADRIWRERKTELERIEGLSEIIHKQQVAEAIERKDARIKEHAAKLEATNDLAKEIEQGFAQLVAKFRKLCAERASLLPYFRAGDPEVQAATNTALGAALTVASISELMAYELYRAGVTVPVPGQTVDPSWPVRAICPRTDWTSTPEKIKPFAQAVAQASSYALELLKTGRAPAILAAPAEGDTRTPAQIELAELLKDQMKLANDPDREQEYFDLMKKVAAVTDRVETERQAIAQAPAAEAAASQGQQRLDDLRRRSTAMVYRGETATPEYAKLAGQIAGLTAILKQQGVVV